MKKGRFITFEGIDGGGKTTQIKLLADALTAAGHKVYLTREPGGSHIGDHIREVLLATDHTEMHGMTELLLFVAARAQHVHRHIIPALEDDCVVLCDRFIRSTEVYQGIVRGCISPADIAELHHLVIPDKAYPDLEVIVDCPVEVIAKRMHDRGQMSRFDREPVEFHQKVRDGYLKVARNYDDVFLIDGNAPEEVVFENIRREVFNWFGFDAKN